MMALLPPTPSPAPVKRSVASPWMDRPVGEAICHNHGKDSQVLWHSLRPLSWEECHPVPSLCALGNVTVTPSWTFA